MIKELNKEFLYNIVSKRLKIARKNTDYTAIEVANLLRIEKSAMSHYENGSNCPTALNIFKLCLLYKVSPGYIFGFEDEYKQISEQKIQSIFRSLKNLGANLGAE